MPDRSSEWVEAKEHYMAMTRFNRTLDCAMIHGPAAVHGQPAIPGQAIANRSGGRVDPLIGH
jgi:hypothetical protein